MSNLVADEMTQFERFCCYCIKLTPCTICILCTTRDARIVLFVALLLVHWMIWMNLLTPLSIMRQNNWTNTRMNMHKPLASLSISYQPARWVFRFSTWQTNLQPGHWQNFGWVGKYPLVVGNLDGYDQIIDSDQICKEKYWSNNKY